MLLLGLIYRWETFSVNSIALNPDEAELLAMSKNVDFSDLGKDYTTSTFGPLLPYVLRLILALNLSDNLGSIHLVGFLSLLVFPISVSIFGYRQRRSNNLSHILIIIAFAQSFGLVFGSKKDYLTFCTEIIPLQFTAVICLLMSTKIRSKDFLSGLLFSCIFFTKIQVLPLAFVFYFILRITIFNHGLTILSLKDNFKYFCYFFLGSLFGIVGFSLWLLQSGVFLKWLNLSFIFSLTYVGTDLESGLGGGNSLPIKFLGALRLIASDVVISSVVLILPIALFGVMLKSRSLFSFDKDLKNQDRIIGLRMTKNPQMLELSIILSIIILTAFFAISAPGNLFSHYLLILYAATTFSILYMSKFISEIHKNTRELTDARMKIRYGVGFLITVFVISLNFSPERSASFANSNYVIANSTIGKNLEKYLDVLRKECHSKSTVLIWGWASEYFGYLNWRPTPDFINDANRLLAKGGSSETLIQLKTLLADGVPDCILSATGANYEFTTYSKGPSLIEYDRDFETIILKNYKPIPIPSEAGLLWIKNVN